MLPMIFQFVDNEEAAAKTIDFLLGPVYLIAGSYQQIVNPQDAWATETFETITRGKTRPIIHAAISVVEQRLNQAVTFFEDETEKESIWLKLASKDETPRRSIIRSWDRIDTSEKKVNDPLLDDSIEVRSKWKIKRAPYWEGLLSSEETITIVVSVLDQDGDGVYLGSTSVSAGSVPARIRSFNLDAGTDGIEKLWFGIHDKYAADWKSYIYTGKTGYYEGIEAWVDDNYSSSEGIEGVVTRVLWTGTTSFVNRFQTQIPNTNHNDIWPGKWLVLLRAKNTNSADVARMAMFYTWTYFDNVGIPRDVFHDVWVEGDDWHFYEMGIIQVPPEGYRKVRRDYKPDLFNLRVGLAAERTSGSGDLWVDHWVFIPYKHFLSLDGIANAGGGSDTYVVTTETGKVIAYNYDFGTAWETQLANIGRHDWRFPVNKQYMIIAAGEQAAGSALSKDLYGTLKLIPRYDSYNAD